MSALQELPPDFIHTAEEQIRFGAPFAFGQVGLDQPVLDFERIAPFLQPDLQITFADQCHQVIRLDAENVLKRLERVLVSPGAFQILGQFEQDFHIAFFNAVGLLVEADGFREIALGPVNIPEPEQRIRSIRVDDQCAFKEIHRIGRPLGHEGVGSIPM